MHGKDFAIVTLSILLCLSIIAIIVILVVNKKHNDKNEMVSKMSRNLQGLQRRNQGNPQWKLASVTVGSADGTINSYYQILSAISTVYKDFTNPVGTSDLQMFVPKLDDDCKMIYSPEGIKDFVVYMNNISWFQDDNSAQQYVGYPCQGGIIQEPNPESITNVYYAWVSIRTTDTSQEIDQKLSAKIPGYKNDTGMWINLL
jgi:hypothetical protein